MSQWEYVIYDVADGWPGKRLHAARTLDSARAYVRDRGEVESLRQDSLTSLGLMAWRSGDLVVRLEAVPDDSEERKVPEATDPVRLDDLARKVQSLEPRLTEQVSKARGLQRQVHYLLVGFLALTILTLYLTSRVAS